MTAPGSDPILVLDDVSKSFGGLAVVENVGFDIARGERVALIGPNGAGKTTVFNLISGVYPIDHGRILLEGKNIVGLPSRRRPALGLARSFQNIRLMPHLSVIENVVLGQHARATRLVDHLTPLRGRETHWRNEACECLSTFGLDTFPGETVSNLPYGVRKKIEVVRALMAKPRILLLDEPAAGLNPRETIDLKDFLLKVAEDGVTLLVVEHDMSFVRSLCERSIVLNFGRKIYDGPTDRVHDDQAVLEAYLGRRKGDAAATVEKLKSHVA